MMKINKIVSISRLVADKTFSKDIMSDIRHCLWLKLVSALLLLCYDSNHRAYDFLGKERHKMDLKDMFYATRWWLFYAT